MGIEEKFVDCLTCGERHRAIWDHDNEKIYIVGQRDQEIYKCEKCGTELDINDSTHKWTLQY